MGKYSELTGKYAHQHLDCHWGNIGREKAEEILKDQPKGTFLVRDYSDRKNAKGAYLVISNKGNGGIIHRLICIYTDYGSPAIEGSIVPEGGIGPFLERHYDARKALLNPSEQQILEKEKAYVRGAVVGFFNTSLPRDLTNLIATFLGKQEGGRLAQTCKMASKLAHEEKANKAITIGMKK